jgi:tRNA-splicing ligase RtcB
LGLFSLDMNANRRPVKMWDYGVEFDDNTIQQLRNIASLPFIHSHVAAMPDAHVGIGATVGSVIATKGAVVPAAVGVDIGCGMSAYQTSLTANDLPDNLGPLRSAIEVAVPHGRTDNGGANDTGTWLSQGGDQLDWRDLAQRNASYRWAGLSDRYVKIVAKHPKVESRKKSQFIGTLGTGNHFIEICLDENDSVWVMLHSGSRGVGNRIGTYFIEKAKEEMRRYYIDKFLPDQDCAYLVEKTDLFYDYVEAVEFAQDFALENRKAIASQVFTSMRTVLPPFSLTETAVNCHHNYISRENHGGQNVIITRKGAVRARQGDLGIIPGSMGTGSFIVRGLGSPHSFCSCSHGAGRRMSRGEAKRKITIEEHVKDEGVLDESPAAYKDIGAVMEAQSDLVEIVYRLRQVVNVKG